MKCTECKYCIEQDEGYSNYNVENTEVNCLLGKNERFPVDRWYGEDKELEYANKCNKFTEGEPVCFDIDGETTIENYKDDAEIYALLKAYDR